MTITIRQPWASPILRSNDRMHWAQKARLTKEIRETTATIARSWMVQRNLAYRVTHRTFPMTGPVTVELVWTVKDKRRRDADSGEPHKKAAIDGLVDAGLISDDRTEVVAWSRCRIEQGTGQGLRLEIRDA